MSAFLTLCAVALVALVSATLHVSCHDPDSTARPAFALVLIDRKTEDRLGPFPFDREVYARAITRLDALGVRAVVIRLLLDQQRTAQGDAALVTAMRRSNAPVVLEAQGHGGSAGSTRVFQDRFVLQTSLTTTTTSTPTRAGIIPRTEFMDSAAGIGLNDIARLDTIPLVHNYNGRWVRSMYLSTFEAAYGGKVEVTPGSGVRIGPYRIEVDDRNEFAVPWRPRPDVQVLSLIDVLEGHVMEADLRGRVVWIGYSGTHAPTISLGGNSYPIIVAEWYSLLAADERIRGTGRKGERR